MEISVQLTREPVPPHPAGPDASEEGTNGSWVEFCGMVRNTEAGRAIAALEYQAYEEMAVSEIERILRDAGRTHPCRSVRVVHRLGVIPVGETAIRVSIGSSHRHEGIALLATFMDRLKQDVPIWKVRAIPAARPAASGLQS